MKNTASAPQYTGHAAQNRGTSSDSTTSIGPLPYDRNEFVKLLQQEAARLNRAAAPNMAVALVIEGSPLAQRLKAASRVLGKPSSRPTVGPYDYGLQAIYLPNSAPLGGRGAACMLLLHISDGPRLWDRYIVPLAATGPLETGAAFASAHAVGHCLTDASRAGLVNRMAWTPEQDEALQRMGLWPQALWKAYGNPMSKDAYALHPEKIEKDPAQQQFEERGADAFAASWILRLGAKKNALSVLEKLVAALPADSAHATAPVFSTLGNNMQAIKGAASLSQLWGLAENVRSRVGTHAGKFAQIAADEGGRQVRDDGVRRWKVTAKGLQEIAPDGHLLPPKKPSVNTVDFNHLKQFGAGTFGSSGVFGGP